MIYLFATPTNYKNGKLTGAHRRFLELVQEFSKNDTVILISGEIPQLEKNNNIIWYKISNHKNKFIPSHIAGMININKKLKQLKHKVTYDRAVSFGPTITICYKVSGIHSITSLFREDLIGYLKVVNTPKMKLLYYQWQEKIAVKASQKIIVQCKNDKNNLIQRNEKYCKDIKDKVFIQINNANASWMKVPNIRKEKENPIIKILFIGEFSNCRKGHGILLPVIAKLIDEGFSLELFVAGDGLEKDHYVHEYIAYPAIKFLGRVNNLQDYLAQSDFLVVPSLIDSCPNTVLEGLNAGIAVYGANTGGIPDLLQDSTYLFQPNTEELYNFLKQKIYTRQFALDEKNQEKLKKSLTFNWARQIKDIIG